MSASNSRDAQAIALWNEHYARLAGWCAALTGDPDSGHDVAAEAFTRLLSHWGHVRDPRGFLYVTALNHIRDNWRREQRDRRLVQRLATGSELCAPAWDSCLRDLVERLPQRLRAPVLLYHYADLSVDDVARALHRPVGTIKRSLAEARARLREELEKEPEIPAAGDRKAS